MNAPLRGIIENLKNIKTHKGNFAINEKGLTFGVISIFINCHLSGVREKCLRASPRHLETP